jgi:hypothetical protein
MILEVLVSNIKNLSDKQNLSTYQKEHFIKYDEDLKFYENLE